MGTEFFIVIGMFLLELSACQVSMFSALQIGQNSPIYMLDTILGRVYDVISHLICLFYPFFKLKYLRN